jgi:methyltransferase (TIGR00027 family)
MADKGTAGPDSTAVRVALWRAIHVEVDAPPHILQDEVGLQLAAPDENWRSRPDMDPDATRLFRASIVARARFIDDLVIECAGRNIGQYVILGAGLDTFAQRRPDIAARLRIFEIDRDGPQMWKRQRLIELGFAIPEWLRFVPVDFEAGGSWWKRLSAAGFDVGQPAVVACTGVSMYLTRDAVAATLREVAALAPGSTLAMSYILPMEHANPEERPAREAAERGARASSAPFLSFFTGPEIVALARSAGFATARQVSAAELAARYFTARTDGLYLSKSEEILLATT